MIFAGIDAGSRAIKIVLIDAQAQVLISSSAEQGAAPSSAINELYQAVLAQRGLGHHDVLCTVATGYARNAISFADTTITEISCHAAGVHHLLPQARTVVEIGGQDSKLLRLSEGGAVRDFAMNDRCAAGTGRFLELVANRLDCQLSELGTLASSSTRPAVISSMCAVFAETEIIGLLANGCACASDIVAGVQASVASRIAAMAGGTVTPPVAFTGGVALIDGMNKALEIALGQKMIVPPRPQFTGALGAALLAMRMKNPSRAAIEPLPISQAKTNL